MKKTQEEIDKAIAEYFARVPQIPEGVTIGTL